MQNPYLNILLMIKKKGGITLTSFSRIIGDDSVYVLERLVREGYLRIENNFVYLTDAGEKALSYFKPKGPRVIVAIKENTHMMIFKPRYGLYSKLREAGYLVGEGYFLKGGFPKKRISYDKYISIIEESLREGRLRYASLRIYSLAKKVKDKDPKLFSDAIDNLREPSYRKCMELLRRLKKTL